MCRKSSSLEKERAMRCLKHWLPKPPAGGTKGNFLLRRTCSLALTIVAVAQSAISRASQRRNGLRTTVNSIRFLQLASAFVLPSIAHQGQVLIPSAIQLNSPGVRFSSLPTPPPPQRLGLLLENLEMTDSIMGCSFV